MADSERPVFFGGLDCWSNRHAAALVDAVDAKRAAEIHPGDESYAKAAADAQRRVDWIESAMAADFYLMLRKADDGCGGGLRADLTGMIGQVIGGMLNEFRNELMDTMEAVARLERAGRG